MLPAPAAVPPMVSPTAAAGDLDAVAAVADRRGVGGVAADDVAQDDVAGRPSIEHDTPSSVLPETTLPRRRRAAERIVLAADCSRRSRRRHWRLAAVPAAFKPI